MIRLISLTPQCEQTIVYCARVSSSNPENPNFESLIRYCAKNGHWSIFEMGNMIIEIEAPRYITAQILRHRSFSFQEFSQRYAPLAVFARTDNITEDTPERHLIAAPVFRSRKESNRQSSESLHPNCSDYQEKAFKLIDQTFALYNEMLRNGVACETARTILPMCVMSRIYVNGTIRSWIHYLKIRCEEHTQLEHQKVANEIKEIFKKHLPIIYEAVFVDK